MLHLRDARAARPRRGHGDRPEPRREPRLVGRPASGASRPGPSWSPPASTPTLVIHSPASARRAGMTGTLVFPMGNLAPQGSVIKATAIDPSVLDADGVLRHRGPARVFTSESAAVDAVKGVAGAAIGAGDVIVLAGIGPLGTGMEETYQLTSALRYLPHGKHVAVVTDGRFSGVSTGACIGHAGPEALAGGPIGRVRDGDIVALEIDTVAPHRPGRPRRRRRPATSRRPTQPRCSASRPPHPGLAPAARTARRHPACGPRSRRRAAARGRAAATTWIASSSCWPPVRRPSVTRRERPVQRSGRAGDRSSHGHRARVCAGRSPPRAPAWS